MQRGIVRHELGQDDAAIADLERSIEYLPTAPAYYTLGEIYEGRGQIDKAIDNYKVVAKSGGGEIQKAAYEKLVLLDLARQPASYVASACGADTSGQVTVQVRNDTPVSITGIEVRFRYVDASGETRDRSQGISGELAPGKVATARTGFTAYPSTRCESAVTQARPASSPSRP